MRDIAVRSKADVERYHRWISEQACAHCNRPGCSQVAHYCGFRQYAYGKSKAKKGDDWFVAPLCHVGGNDCHSKMDRYLLGEAVASDVIAEWDSLPRHVRKELAHCYQSELFQHWILNYQRLARIQGVISEIKVTLE